MWGREAEGEVCRLSGGGPEPESAARPCPALRSPPGLGRPPWPLSSPTSSGSASGDQRSPRSRSRRLGRHPYQRPRGWGRALHRRDPPPRPGGRGAPLPGDGGVQDRYHSRPGTGGPDHPPRPAAVTLVGATTRPGLITGPMRSRFGIIEHLEYYTDEELAEGVTRDAEILGFDLEASAASRSAAGRAGPCGWRNGCCAASATSPMSPARR